MNREETSPGDDDLVTIACRSCGATLRQPLRWVQERRSFVCPRCHATVPIDKDRAMIALARTELGDT
jgi:hypothetical protein